MSQLALAANAVVATGSQTQKCRMASLARVAQMIARTQHRNRKAKQSHHRRTLQRLARHGIDIAACRCCIPENKLW